MSPTQTTSSFSRAPRNLLAAGVLLAGAAFAQGLPDQQSHRSPATHDLPQSIASALGVRAGRLQTIVAPPPTGLNSGTVRVTVRLGARRAVLELRPFDIRTPDFRLLLDDGQTLRAADANEVSTYRGTVRGVPGSTVAATLYAGTVRATIRMPSGDWSVQPLLDVQPGVPASLHVSFAHRDVIQDPSRQCIALEPPGHRHRPHGTGAGSTGNAFTSSTRIANLAIDVDNLYYARYSRNTVLTLSAVLSIINVVDAIYRRDVDVIHRISAIIIRTTPVYTATTVRTRLDEFRVRWNLKHRNIRRDIAHLFTGVGSFSGVIGVAWLGVVCASTGNGYGYGASKAYSNPANNVGLVAHELGHNWGSGHCNATSSCNIMCSSIGGCSGNRGLFGPFAKQAILSFKNTARCLETTRELPGQRIASNLINNGGFEHGRSVRAAGTVALPQGSNDLPGWQVFNGSIRHEQSGVYAAEGLRCLDLSSTTRFAGIRRTVLTRPGFRYHLTFAAAATGTGDRFVQIANGIVVDTFRVEPSTAPDLKWQRYSFSFVAAANTTPIEITSPVAGSGGPYLDAVQIIENLLVQPVGNPDFETGPNPGVSVKVPIGSNALAPWAIAGDAIDYFGGFGPAASGRRAVDLNGGVIRQTIHLVRGQRYVVLFEMAGNPDGGPTRKRVQVQTGFRNADFFFDTTGKTRANLGWETRSMEFTPTADFATLAFWSPVRGEYGPLIDNVRVLPLHRENLVINDSFESHRIPYSIEVPRGGTQIPGWEVTGGIARLIGTQFGAAHGVQSVQLGNGAQQASIRTRIPVVPARRYRLLFRITAPPGVGSQQFVSVRTPSGATTIGQVGGAAYDDMRFVAKTVEFTGPANGFAWIEFVGLSRNTPLFLDAVRVDEVEGHYQAFGNGCGRSGGPRLVGTLAPSLGRPFQVRLSNLPTARATGAVLTGGSRTRWGALDLPLALDFLGATGCSLLVAPATTTSVATSQSSLLWGFPVPNDGSLFGGRFYNQAVFLDPGANALNTVLSNAGVGVVGR